MSKYLIEWSTTTIPDQSAVVEAPDVDAARAHVLGVVASMGQVFKSELIVTEIPQGK